MSHHWDLSNQRFSLISIGLLWAASLVQAADFYVSPSGDDANPGTLQAPFQTITKARDAVKAINTNMTTDIHVYLRGGNYRIASAINFTPADGGTGGHRIYYQAYNNETPVLNGGVQVTGWTLDNGNVYKATLDRSTKLRSLIVNNKRAYMAKKTVTSGGGWGTYSVTSGQATWAWKSGSQFDGMQYSTNDVPALANASDVEIINSTSFNSNIVCVREITTSGSSRILKLQQPYGAIALNQGWSAGFSATGSHVIQNAYEFLNSAGTFYFNKTTKTLYYYKRSGEDMGTAVVYAPSTETLINILGTSKTSRVENLTFKGITFGNTEAVLPKVDSSSGKTTVQGSNYCIAYANSDWHAEQYRAYDVMSNAINVSNAASISFEDNVLQHVGNEGIGFINDVLNSQIVGNVIYDVGGSAIQVGHPQHIYETNSNTREKYATSTKGICKTNLIQNNLLYDMTTMYTGHSSISAYFVDSLTIVHNHIEGTNYVGVSVGWGWCNFDSIAVPGNPTRTCKRNTFNNNRVFDCMRVLNDGGAYYTLGSQPGSQCYGNYVKASTTHFQGVIHADEGTAWYNGGNMVFEITAGQDNAELNDWGRKHDDHYDNIYTTSSALTSGGPRCSMTNIHVYPKADWPAEALAIIKNSGLDSAHQNLTAKMSIGIPTAGIQPRAAHRSLQSYNLSMVPDRSTNSLSILNPDKHQVATTVYNTSGQRIYLGTTTDAAQLRIPLPASHGIFLISVNVDGSPNPQKFLQSL
jgi:hypothetical protein